MFGFYVKFKWLIVTIAAIATVAIINGVYDVIYDTNTLTQKFSYSLIRTTSMMAKYGMLSEHRREVFNLDLGRGEWTKKVLKLKPEGEQKLYW